MPFPGYSIITPPNSEDPANSKFYDNIKLLQQSIIQQLEPGLIVPLSAESFHFTLADIIWDDSYKQAVEENSQFDTQLQEQIKESFAKYQATTNYENSVQWQLLGISVRPRAIMACLVPKDQESYQAIIDLRRCVYQNAGLMGLGVEQQYDFTGHVTLGYFSSISDRLNRSEVCVIISQISDRLLESEPTIIDVERAELRKFDNMLHYHRQPDWTAISLGKATDRT